MKKVIKIEGMMCEGCVNRIKNALNNFKGVKVIELSLDTKTLTFEIENESIFKNVVECINDLGFEIKDN